jgi:hypothetical protein
MQDRRGLIANDFSKESLNSLSQFCTFVTIPELKARLADISWVTKAGSVEHAHMAIESYIESAKNLLAVADSWIHPAERIERALRLSCMFRRDSQWSTLKQESLKTSRALKFHLIKLWS